MKNKLGRIYIAEYLHQHALQKCMLRKQDCNVIVDIVIEAIVNALADGEDVGLVGLGRFITVDKNPKRPVRNFKTGEFYELDKMVRALKFEPSSVLKNKMRDTLEASEASSED